MLIFHDAYKIACKIRFCVHKVEIDYLHCKQLLLNDENYTERGLKKKKKVSNGCIYLILQMGTSLAAAYLFEARMGYSTFQKKES